MQRVIVSREVLQALTGVSRELSRAQGDFANGRLQPPPSAPAADAQPAGGAAAPPPGKDAAGAAAKQSRNWEKETRKERNWGHFGQLRNLQAGPAAAAAADSPAFLPRPRQQGLSLGAAACASQAAWQLAEQADTGWRQVLAARRARKRRWQHGDEQVLQQQAALLIQVRRCGVTPLAVSRRHVAANVLHQCLSC